MLRPGDKVGINDAHLAITIKTAKGRNGNTLLLETRRRSATACRWLRDWRWGICWRRDSWVATGNRDRGRGAGLWRAVGGMWRIVSELDVGPGAAYWAAIRAVHAGSIRTNSDRTLSAVDAGATIQVGTMNNGGDSG